MMYLETIELMLHDLPEVTAECDSLSAGEQTGWSMDWGNEMSGLQALSRWVSEGALEPKQVKRYKRILAGLRDVIHLVDRLALRRPPAELLA